MIAAAKLAGALLYPFNLALLALLLGVLLRWHARLSRGLIVFALAWLWLWSTPWIAERAAATLERGHPPMLAEALPDADAIVLLGGLMTPAQPPDYPYGDLNSAADRAWFAARLWHAGKAPRIICSGGLAPLSRAMAPECPDVLRLLGDFGVPARAVTVEAGSRTTAENARETTRLLPTGARILLVTSAGHMDRAVAVFRRAGLDPVAAATDHRFRGQPLTAASVLPSVGALALSTQVWHEWLGRAWYGLVER